MQYVIKRLVKLLTHQGVLVEDIGQTCRAEPDANIDGFSLHPAARVGEGDRGC